jgi:rhodanese-related sulfurtransferase
MRKHIAAALLWLVVAAGLVRASDKTYPTISHDELARAVTARTATILDANGTDSYSEGHIPGALDFEAVKGRLSSLLPTDRTALIVAYCANEDCPDFREAAEAAEALGYSNVKHYPGGIEGWKQSGARVESAK